MTHFITQTTKTLLLALGALCCAAISTDAEAAPRTAHVVRTPNPAGNACGEAPWNEVFSVFVNDGPRNVLRPACQFHDRCYWGGTHGFPFMGNRRQCDDAWHGQMLAACNRLPETPVPVGRSRTTLRAACISQAEMYYTTVRNLAGFMWAGNPRDNN